MRLPSRRRGRQRGDARLAAVNDTQAVQEWLGELRTGPADGTTVPLSALRGQPHYPPAAVLPMPQARAVMTVYPPGPGVPAPTPEALEVVRHLRAEVLILRRRGQLDRISDEKLRLVPGDRATNRRTTARLIVDGAIDLLRCGGDAS